MTDLEFWRLIALIDRSALADGEDEAAVAPLVDALAAQPSHRIESFEEQLSQKLYALDGRLFADAAGASGQSGDGFLYARCQVVAYGEQRYESVRNNPHEMPTSLDEWCEALLYAASEAYERSTGKTWEFFASVSYETGTNRALWEGEPA